MIKHQEEYSDLRSIKSECHKAVLLGQMLYLLFTSDLPTTEQITGTFTNDTIIMSSHKDPKITSSNLQKNIEKIQV